MKTLAARPSSPRREQAGNRSVLGVAPRQLRPKLILGLEGKMLEHPAELEHTLDQRRTRDHAQLASPCRAQIPSMERNVDRAGVDEGDRTQVEYDSASACAEARDHAFEHAPASEVQFAGQAQRMAIAAHEHLCPETGTIDSSAFALGP
ncbi:MAG TPA: hypothetical protein VH025_05645 [Solirubrobacteraceae bacterium]|jgi:hypothetical protein|nr:hypothetical protein [Solirubrobacteraceae bacterium]